MPPPVEKSSVQKQRSTLRAHLGAALQRHRLNRGLTQARLAEAAAVSLKYVGEIERGEANTTLGAIERLGDAIGWNPMDAIEGAREPLTEGVRRHLLVAIRRTRERFADMEGWLHALDPARQLTAPSALDDSDPLPLTRRRAPRQSDEEGDPR